MTDLILQAVKTCATCGTSNWYPKGICKACQKVRCAKWYAANKKEIPKSTQEYRKKWAAENPEKCRAHGAKHRAENAEQNRATQSAYRIANPDVMRLKAINYRAKKKAAGGILSKGLAEKLFVLQRGMCPCCQQPLGDDYHMDHKMPLALGGPNTDDNIQLLRGLCNYQKHAKHPIDFMQQRGFLL